MVKPLAICIEGLDAVSEASRYLRWIALPGRQPGLRLDETGSVQWQAGDVPSCELWVSADNRLILYRQKEMSPVVLRRGGRSLDVPSGKPVVVIDKDQIDVGPRRLRIHVHGEAAAVAAPFPLPIRSPLASLLAQTVATAALLGAVASGGGCTEVEVRETPPVMVERPPTAEVSMTTTPETAKSVEPRRMPTPTSTLSSAQAAATAIAMESLLRDFAGEYVSAGPAGKGRLAIRPDLTYTFARVEPSGAEHRREGRLVTVGNSVRLDEEGSGSAALLPVLCGERRYLVEANALGRFCASDSGEPRTTREGYFHLRDGDWSQPAEGEPALLDGTPVCSAR
jgi:hypothetical protein